MGFRREGTESLKQEEKKSFIILALDWEEMAETPSWWRVGMEGQVLRRVFILHQKERGFGDRERELKNLDLSLWR